MKATDNKNPSRVELRDVARVQPGYLSRTQVQSSPNGTHVLLQAKNVSNNGDLRLATAARFNPERNPDLYRVSRGDILLIARGQNHNAHLVDADLRDVLASSVFYIIRPNEGKVLPGYLSWYINQPNVQSVLDSASSGTGIGYITRPAIEQISIIVPPLDTQHRIVDAIGLWRRQQSLQAGLELKRSTLLHAFLRQAIRLEKD